MRTSRIAVSLGAAFALMSVAACGGGGNNNDVFATGSSSSRQMRSTRKCRMPTRSLHHATTYQAPP